MGQNVVVRPSIFCGICSPCQNGADNACPKSGFIGLSGGGGGLSDALVVARDKVLSLPENVPLDIGALAEPLSVAWHAVRTAGDAVNPQSTVLVLGGGPIGLAVVQCLKAKKVKNIIVSEIAVRRQEFAKDFGADYILNPKEDDVVAKTAEISGIDGADAVFDAAGVPARYQRTMSGLETMSLTMDFQSDNRL